MSENIGLESDALALRTAVSSRHALSVLLINADSFEPLTLKVKLKSQKFREKRKNGRQAPKYEKSTRA